MEARSLDEPGALPESPDLPLIARFVFAAGPMRRLWTG
jgi:hypothetical protein